MTSFHEPDQGRPGDETLPDCEPPHMTARNLTDSELALATAILPTRSGEIAALRDADVTTIVLLKAEIDALRIESRRLWDDLKNGDAEVERLRSLVTMLEFERDVAQNNVEALTERIEELSPGYKAQLRANLEEAERIGRELDEAIKDGRFPPDGWEIVR